MTSRFETARRSTPIRIALPDFLEFYKGKEYFLKHLDFPFEVSENPDVVIFGFDGRENQRYRNCLKIGFISENRRPSFLECDLSLGCDYSDYNNRNLRWPFYNCYLDYDLATKSTYSDTREKFCSVVVSNYTCRFRNEFFFALSKYKHVDSGGRAFNNIGGNVEIKHDFLLKYKFNIAFENSAYPGYVTEKIVEAKQAGCIPIYWGSPRVADDFNPKAFINLQDFASFADCIKYIEYIDSNQNAYNAMRNEPLLPGGKYTQYSDPQVLKKWLVRAVYQKPCSLHLKTSNPFFRAHRKALSIFTRSVNIAYCRKYGIWPWRYNFDQLPPGK